MPKQPSPPVGEPTVPAHLADHQDDENGFQKGYVRGTDFSLPYMSRWSRMHGLDIGEDLLRHLNCGYLSTQGLPPTLLALKQHAQSLCILIQALSPNLRSAEILLGDPSTLKGDKSPFLAEQAADYDMLGVEYDHTDAFDFLKDLTVSYANDDPNHNKPLTGLANEVRRRHEAHGTDYHCPFAQSTPRVAGEPQRPYHNHHSLVMHANACLERLDHEFGSTGGLMSILPTSADHDDGNLTNARKSLLGQWLVFTQNLVARQHELERSYSNALDALAGEAAIPHQSLSTLGPDGRSGREIVYPQDKWLLVNSGEDVFQHVHAILDKQEALIQSKERIWREQGVVGDHIWEHERGGRDYARGIVPVTIPTRYYRLAGTGRYTLFVVPAWGTNPATEYSREIAMQPTVVATPLRRFPPPISELEKGWRERALKTQEAMSENVTLRSEAVRAQEQISTLAEHSRQLAGTRDALMEAVGKENAALAQNVNKEREKARELERQHQYEVAGLREELKEARDELAAARGRA
ncbi:hypothetical protein B0T25DRAFT_544876 [Lasiosphaeria hispida]|uniref:Uncharacterized protein n=1 Tax=Lasiosphaeria hispida TaxID=260671 RepID=A0AAJ0HIZ8_9PEZI|nr:hypothetical protein B0T25DRAFT_544876 [Lasiosphaeria hispida]